MRTPVQLHERLDRYQTRASDAHAAGFTNEAKRKDALQDVNTAWEALRELITLDLLAEDRPARSDAWYDLYDSFPYYPHLWNAKLAAKYAVRWPNEAARATSLRALRDGIKGAELKAKAPRPKTAEQVRKEAAEMTCQICGRGIFAETGVIAHHGYTRPWEGRQTASCPGARQLPFEVSCVALGDEVDALEIETARQAARIERIHTEDGALMMTWETKEVRHVGRRGREYVQQSAAVTRDNWEAVVAVRKASERHNSGIGYGGWDAFKAQALREASSRLAALENTLKVQRERLQTWKQTHRAGGPGETTWVAL